MAQTLAQINKQIERLQKEADALRQAETNGVIERIKVAISHYGLTAEQLGLGKSSVKAAGSKKSATKKTDAPRFSNGDGQVWVGRGPRPLWLREALESGRSIDEFDNTRARTVPKVSSSAAPANASLMTSVPASSSAVASKRINRATKGKTTGKILRSKPTVVPTALATAKHAPQPKAKRVARKGAASPVAQLPASENFGASAAAAG